MCIRDSIDTARSLSQQKSLIRQLRQHVGFVFQNFNLFPHRTVLENIIEGPVTVSYTHLDVYKRQKFRLVRMTVTLSLST